MGSGGSGPTQQNITSTTTSTNLPAYAQPYVEDLLQRGQSISSQAPPGMNQQVADFTPLQQQAFQDTAALQTPGQFNTASTMATQAGLGALQAGQNYQAPQFSYNQVAPSQLQQYQMQGPQAYTGANVNQYMSPYMQDVVNTQQQEAVRNATMGNLGANLASAAQGTYGGARNTLLDAENQRNLSQQLNQIQATGSQNAFQNAQQQFNAQQQLQQTANQQNLNAQLSTQQLGAGQNLTAQQLNQAANLQTQQAQAQAGQFGANLNLQGLQQTNQAALDLGQLGTQQLGANLNVLQAQAATGQQQQAQNQNLLNTAYQNYMTQYNYPMQQLGYYSSLIHGLPMQMGTASTIATPAPSMLSQLTGAGLGALGVSKLMGSS